MDHFSKSFSKFGLKISLSKTKVMFSLSLGQAHIEPNILVNGTSLEVLNTFVYLGSVLTRDSSHNSETFL